MSGPGRETRWCFGGAATAGARSSEGADLLLRIEDLSDEQVEAMLTGRLPAEGI